MFGLVVLLGQYPSFIKREAGVTHLQTRINVLCTQPKNGKNKKLKRDIDHYFFLL